MGKKPRVSDEYGNGRGNGWCTPAYMPTEEQIILACDGIRAGWSDDEYERRAGSADRIRPVEFRPVYVRPAVYDAFGFGKL